MALGDEKVAWLKPGGRSYLRRSSRYWPVAHIERLVGGRPQEAVEIDVHIDNRSAGSAEGFGKLLGVCDDLRDRIRGGVHADCGDLQINEDECSLLGGRAGVLLWFLFLENIWNWSSSGAGPGRCGRRRGRS